MQDSQKIEREARKRLPDILADLLDESRIEVEPATGPGDVGVDIAGQDALGRMWLMEVKSSSRPGLVSAAAEQLRAFGDDEAIAVLVVPFMSPAGAKAAEGAGLNWIDLSGNAHLRAENLHVEVRGHPNQFRSRGRPSSPFAPRSARVARTLLLEPSRWWRQKELAQTTGLDDGSVSRIVRRLDDEFLLKRRGRELRPRDPALLLDAWAEDYRFDRHYLVAGHLSGSGMALARDLAERLEDIEVRHAFTGLAAAWAIDRFARFRLTTVFVQGDPHEIADRLEIRQAPQGANVQLVEPDDEGVFMGECEVDGLRCVSAVQIYLDLLNLPERAGEAASHLRTRQLRWTDRAR